MKHFILAAISMLVIVIGMPVVLNASTPSRRDDSKVRTISEIEGLNVKVKSCTADDNDNVFITFTIENTNDFTEGEIYFRESVAKAFDDEGNVYEGEKSIRFARGTDKFMSWCPVVLPTKIPTKYRMRISNVDPAASVLKEVVFELYQPLHTSERFMGLIHLKNVPIKRAGDE